MMIVRMLICLLPTYNLQGISNLSSPRALPTPKVNDNYCQSILSHFKVRYGPCLVPPTQPFKVCINLKSICATGEAD